MADRVLKHLEECKDPPKLFTYYQGDINTAVDEHFFRALNKATTPKDLSTKAKDSNRIPKSGMLMSMHLNIYLFIYLSNVFLIPDVPSSSWASSGLTWSKSTHSSGSSKLAQLTTMELPPLSHGVIVNPSVPSSSSSSSLWPCPPRQGTAFERPQILYQQPMAAESSASSYMNLLQMDRPTGSIVISPFSKSETRPEWNSGMAYKDGSRIGLDSGTCAIASNFAHKCI